MRNEYYQEEDADLQELNNEVLRHRRKRRAIRLIAAAVVCAFVVFFAALRISDITVVGASNYTQEELIELIFDDAKDYSTVYTFFAEIFLDHDYIPLVEEYHISVTGLTSAKVIVYEKSVVGCIEYMGRYMYFDKDGIVVDSSSELTDGVPQITGITFTSIVMYSVIGVEDDDIFDEILNLTQTLDSNDIAADRIHYDSDMNATVYIGDLKIYLGSSEYVSWKVAELADMLPQIEGMSGTVYLDSYDPDSTSQYYSFVED